MRDPLCAVRVMVVAALLSVSMGGCAFGGQSSNGGRTGNLIDEGTIQSSSAGNAYDLVQQLRPNWLRGRGAESFNRNSEVLPVVYVGQTRHGPVDLLRSFGLGSISEIRYINATTATTRFGSGHSGGIIELVLKN